VKLIQVKSFKDFDSGSRHPPAKCKGAAACVAEGMRSGSLYEGTERGHSACEGSEIAAVRFYDT
jgi:hypothetical protein